MATIDEFYGSFLRKHTGYKSRSVKSHLLAISEGLKEYSHPEELNRWGSELEDIDRCEEIKELKFWKKTKR